MGAVMRPLIANLPQRVEAYNRRYDSVVKVLREEAGDIIVVPTQDERVGTVGDHLNFYLTGVTDEQNALFRQTCVAMSVPVSWFQSKVNARWHVNWRKSARRPSTCRTRTRSSASRTTSRCR